jgi:predicted metal-dependent enzyme (double-stranded beta helix superfamily)
MLEREVIPHVRAWLRDQTIAPTLFQLATGNASVYTNLGAARSLAIAVVRAEIEDEARNVRHRLASVASDAYHASGMARLERGWQECRLIHYLLG